MSERNKALIRQIELYGVKAQGRKELVSHLGGKKLTLKQAIMAKCYDCTMYYADGKEDCGMGHCPLHPHMPYNAAREKRKATPGSLGNFRGAAGNRRTGKKDGG